MAKIPRRGSRRSNPVKPVIWQIIGDKWAGGSNHLVKRMNVSRLSDRFDFRMLRLEEIAPEIPRPDAIIFHYPRAWKYLPDLLRLKSYAPVYIYDHHYCRGFEDDRVSSRARFRLLLKLSATVADEVIAVSRAQQEWMLENRLTPPKKMSVITPASPVEALLQIPPKKPDIPLILGAYGRFTRQKGFDVLLKAMARLSPERFRLRLGGYGPDEAEIEALARDLPHVTLSGAIEDVGAFLASCDAVIIPSRWEPWGLVMQEAKAAGKAIVASAVDGLPEQILGCGLLVPPDDVDALASAITSLPESPLAMWGAAGRASVTDAWEEFLQNWENFLEKAIAHEMQPC